MLSLQSAFLPVHPLDSNETTAQCLKAKCVKTMAKVSEKSWCWKYHKGKEIDEAECTHNMEKVTQPRYSNITLSWRLQPSEDFHGKNWQRGYPIGECKDSTFHRAEKTMWSHSLGVFVWPYSLTPNRAACLVFKGICWLWRRIRTWVGRKHIGNQGQCTVSFAILIWLFFNISWALDHRGKL